MVLTPVAPPSGSGDGVVAARRQPPSRSENAIPAQAAERGGRMLRRVSVSVRAATGGLYDGVVTEPLCVRGLFPGISPRERGGHDLAEPINSSRVVSELLLAGKRSR
jgi:hypothetical protein